MLRFAKTPRRFSNIVKQQPSKVSEESRRPPNYVADMKQLDETLNLNTHIFTLEDVDQQVNSRFIAKSRVGMIKQHATIAFYNSMLRFNMSKGPLMKLLRQEVAKINDMKLNSKPSIKKHASIGSDASLGYEYLLQLTGDEEMIAEFLDTEKKYLMSHIVSKGNLARLNQQGIMQQMPVVYPDESYVCDGWKYFNGNGDKLNLLREPVWNSESILKDDKTARENLVSSDSLKEYFLDFKDDFSYFLCRYLKNNEIRVTDLKDVKVAEALDLLGAKLVIDNNEILVIRQLNSGKYYMAYFPNVIDEFWFASIKGESALVYKLKGSERLHYLPLKSKIFAEIGTKPVVIKSIGEYMKAHADKLRDNIGTSLIDNMSRLLYESDEGESTALDYFGSNLFIKTTNTSQMKYNLWWLGEDSMKMILVTL